MQVFDTGNNHIKYVHVFEILSVVIQDLLLMEKTGYEISGSSIQEKKYRKHLSLQFDKNCIYDKLYLKLKCTFKPIDQYFRNCIFKKTFFELIIQCICTY